MGTDLDPQTAGAVAILTRSDLQEIVREYFIASRTGDTMSYRESAALDVEIAAMTSTDWLWAKFKEVGLLGEQGELESAPIEELLLTMEFVAGEDIVAGQVCVMGHDNIIKGKPADVRFDVPEVPVHRVTDELLKAVGVNTADVQPMIRERTVKIGEASVTDKFDPPVPQSALDKSNDEFF